jgi:hypothetical protein
MEDRGPETEKESRCSHLSQQAISTIQNYDIVFEKQSHSYSNLFPFYNLLLPWNDHFEHNNYYTVESFL